MSKKKYLPLLLLVLLLAAAALISLAAHRGAEGDASSAAPGCAPSSSDQTDYASLLIKDGQVDCSSVGFSLGLTDDGRYEGVRALDYVSLPEGYLHIAIPEEWRSAIEQTPEDPVFAKDAYKTGLSFSLLEACEVNGIPESALEDQLYIQERMDALYLKVESAVTGKTEEEILRSYKFDSFDEFVDSSFDGIVADIEYRLILQAVAEDQDIHCDMEDAERFYGAELEEQLYLFGRNHVMQRVLEDKVLEYLYENRQV